MADQALRDALYNRGYQLYLTSRAARMAEIPTNRPDIDEEKYHRMPFEQMMRLASGGDRDAQYCVGDHYANSEDMRNAVTWFKYSAQNGNAEAMEVLGQIYQHGISGWEQNDEKARYWLEMAAKTACTYLTAEALVELYVKQNKYQDYEKAVGFAILAAEMTTNPQAQLDMVMEVIALLQLLNVVDLEMKGKTPEFVDYQEIEDRALQNYYWLGVARDLGANLNDSSMVQVSEVLCQAGEAALMLRKPEAKSILQEAMRSGADYAAVLLVPEAISKAWDIKSTPGAYRITEDFIIPSATPNQMKMADSYVREYFPCVQRAASNIDFPVRQAEALYRLSHFYIFGLCCRRNISTAYQYMQQAADLGHVSAQNMLPRFHKKFLGGWEIR